MLGAGGGRLDIEEGGGMEWEKDCLHKDGRVDVNEPAGDMPVARTLART